jgi:hypothetical protein
VIGTAPLSFDQANEQVEDMVKHGLAFGRVEDAINAAGFSQPHKAALWLLAWSLRDSTQQRRDARMMAEAFAADREAPSPQLERGPHLAPVERPLSEGPAVPAQECASSAPRANRGHRDENGVSNGANGGSGRAELRHGSN